MSFTTFYERADFQALSEIFGIKVPRPATQEELKNPSPVLVQYIWGQIPIEAERIEKLFASIYAKLYTLKEWELRGIVNKDELDQSKEWFDLRMRALPLLLWRYGLLDEKFTDGAGI